LQSRLRLIDKVDNLSQHLIFLKSEIITNVAFHGKEDL